MENSNEEVKVLKFVNKSPNPDPDYANMGDSGFDIRAWINETDDNVTVRDGKPSICLEPFETRLFHTGLYFELPKRTEIQVRTRSGMALKEQLVVLNSPGTVDEFYTNEVGVILTNMSNKYHWVANGDRIAQGVLCPVYNNPFARLEKTDEIKENQYRNKKGFGSSGVI